MRMGGPSFGRVFDIYYKPATTMNNKGEFLNTSSSDVYEKLENDYSELKKQEVVTQIDVVEHKIDIKDKLYPKGLRIFTGKSYDEYKMMETLSKDAAKQYLLQESKTYVVTV